MLNLIKDHNLSEATLEGLEVLFKIQKSFGVPDRLLVHHEMVLNTAIRIVNGLPSEVIKKLDVNLVLSGSAIHDIGKLIIPQEIYSQGSDHEQAGELLLIILGFPNEIATFCNRSIDSIEKAISVLADSIWTGRRDEGIELSFLNMIVGEMDLEFWDTFKRMDVLLESVAQESFQDYKTYIELFSTN